jgi:hypothetical protein
MKQKAKQLEEGSLKTYSDTQPTQPLTFQARCSSDSTIDQLV